MNKIAKGQPQRVSDCLSALKRRTTFAPFEHADKGSIQTRKMCEVFLGQITPVPEATHGFAQTS